KGLIVVVHGVLDGVMPRKGALDEHLPAQLAPPRPTCHLRQQVERLLGGAEIGIAEDGVGGEDRGESDVREVMSLAQHLRADEALRLAAPEAVEDPDQLPLLSRRVTIEHLGGDVREVAPEAFLDLLRAEADRLQHLALTEGALRRDAQALAAVVAEEHSL